MKKTVFKGAATALITPFDEKGINYEQFGRIIDWQIESGINGLVVCGTTGEASTMTDDEHREAIALYRQTGRRAWVPVIAGTRVERHRLLLRSDQMCRRGGRRRGAHRHPLLQQGHPAGPLRNVHPAGRSLGYSDHSL